MVSIKYHFKLKQKEEREGKLIMRKTFLFAALATCVVVGTTIGVKAQVVADRTAQAQQIESVVTVTYNKEKMNLHGKKPYYTKKTLMVPIQTITEDLGATVKKNQKGQLIIDNWKHIITLTPGKKYISVDGNKRKLSEKIVNKKGVIYAPYDLLEKDFDLSVSLDKENDALSLETKVEVECLQIEDQLIAGIRFRGQYTEIADYYLALREVVDDRAIGGGFSLYYDQDYENGHDTEICLKITEAFDPTIVAVNDKEVTVSCRTLEGGDFLSVTHLGHANTLGYIWAQIEQYAVDHCITFGGASREIYEYEDFTDDRKQVTTVQIRVYDKDAAVPQIQKTEIYLNNEKIDLKAEPVFADLNKKLILPTELIANNLAAEVYYTNSRKEMTIITKEHRIVIPANSAYITVDGKEHSVSAECLSLNNTIYVPQDFFEIYFNVDVIYNQDKDAFYFTTK